MAALSGWWSPPTRIGRFVGCVDRFLARLTCTRFSCFLGVGMIIHILWLRGPMAVDTAPAAVLFRLSPFRPEPTARWTSLHPGSVKKNWQNPKVHVRRPTKSLLFEDVHHFEMRHSAPAAAHRASGVPSSCTSVMSGAMPPARAMESWSSAYGAGVTAGATSGAPVTAGAAGASVAAGDLGAAAAADTAAAAASTDEGEDGSGRGRSARRERRARGGRPPPDAPEDFPLRLLKSAANADCPRRSRSRASRSRSPSVTTMGSTWS